MAILPESRYDDIRVALDPTLGPVAMPSEVIGSFMYLGKAMGVDPGPTGRDPHGSGARSSA
jgi:hypothetical protein